MSNTKFENGTELENHVRDRITTTGVWKMDMEGRRIGNDRAFALVEALEERMTRMENALADQAKELVDQAKELADQKEKATGRNRKLWKVRVSDLEAVIKKSRSVARFERNEIVHGGDVLNDYQALKYADRPDNNGQFTTASEGFKKVYGLNLDSLSYDDLAKAPEGVVDMLNLRGNSVFLRHFEKEYKEQSSEIQTVCDSAVKKWLDSTGPSGVPYPEDEVKADYERVKELHDSVRDEEVRELPR